MKKRIILPLLLTIGLVVLFMTACKKENQSKTYSLSGKAQKGPFVTGANVTINELNDKLEQTGKSFTSSISADDGSFSLNSVELESNIALITINGYYFDEACDCVPGTLNIQALVDLSGKSSVNVNAMTHVLKDRIEVLFNSGLSFTVASRQAKDELLLSLFGITGTSVKDFDQMDLTMTGDDNAILLAFSMMMLRETYGGGYASILTELLTKLRTDFKDDGIINNPQLLTQIWDNVRFLNPIIVKNNLIKRYQQMGLQVDLPDVQKYISKYVEKYADTIYQDYYYPELAVSAEYGADNTEYINILDKSKTTFTNANSSYFAIAVITPLNKSVTIKFKPSPGNTFDTSNLNFMNFYTIINYAGWYSIKAESDEVILTSARQNLLVSYNTFRWVPINTEVIVEYYENEDITPTFTKTIIFVN
jgi:hypothetical protein